MFKGAVKTILKGLSSPTQDSIVFINRTKLFKTKQAHRMKNHISTHIGTSGAKMQMP